MNFGGGGFMNGPESNDFSSTTTQFGDANGGTPKKKFQDNSLRPVTIQQAKGATQQQPDAPFQLDNHELLRVQIIGRCEQKVAQSTMSRFKIEDGTGAIDVHLYSDESPDSPEAPINQVKEGTYVLVIGTLKSFNDKRSVRASVVRPLADMNQLTYHLLEVIRAHLSLTKVKSSSAGAGAANGVAASAANPYAAAGAITGDGHSGLEKQIMDVIEATIEDQGANVAYIAAQLKRPEQDVRSAVERLAQNGNIYSTVDDDHFKSCA